MTDFLHVWAAIATIPGMVIATLFVVWLVFETDLIQTWGRGLRALAAMIVIGVARLVGYMDIR